MASTDHCVEFLRQSALCQPKTFLTTFKWDPEKTRPIYIARKSVHTCVNWDILIGSMAAHQVSSDEIRRLKNPLLSVWAPL